jgi:hypothetical protein
MADTKRTLSQLVALLPDNISGDISPQDLRDFLVSAAIQGPGVYDDMLGDIRGSIATSTDMVEEAFRDTPFALAFVRHDRESQFSLSTQMSHAWEPTTSVLPHLHILPMANGSGNVLFTIRSAWAHLGYSIPALSGWTSETVTVGLVPGDQYSTKLVAFSAISPPPATTTSAVLLWHITRNGTNVLDTYTTSKDHGTAQANIGILYADLHYLITRPGTEGIYT